MGIRLPTSGFTNEPLGRDSDIGLDIEYYRQIKLSVAQRCQTLVAIAHQIGDRQGLNHII
ncbi:MULTISPECIES: hypothetical protein [Cyanophyceae]|uniref:Uncharacterized protein n=1 Tax=Leptolyngbya subtilissima DQ-A4 TaxID=2933933 RepID=A0ABV0K4X6_9CYAN|nr:hypothetical protein [Nodosilinea sp. FACHB-141]MBD2112779.1 hypothetical protein [Nodosilinea sp. FACHB-141]